MKKLSRLLSLTIVPAILLAIFALSPVTTTVAAPSLCKRVKHIDNLQGDRVLLSRGFHIVEESAGSVDYRGRGAPAVAELNLMEDLSGNPVVARITEVDNALPVEQRVRCWQPDERFDVVAEFEIRFAQAQAPAGLTEAAFLWNAPLEEGSALPFTAFGVIRNQLMFGPYYMAVVAQNVDLSTGSGYLAAVPLPVDPTQWHSIRVTMSQGEVSIEAAQGVSDYQTVLVGHPPDPIVPLALEYSLDNELFPGVHAPVTVPDTLEIEKIDIRRVNNHR